MKQYIVAIDPGPTESAFVILDITHGIPGELLYFGKDALDFIKKTIYEAFERLPKGQIFFSIEMPACYGMAVGASVFDTCAIVGRVEEWIETEFSKFLIYIDSDFILSGPIRIYRKRPSDFGIDGVCMSICKNNRAKDVNVRQALIDMFPKLGGGKTPQIGTKSSPGPLYGVSNDVWAALAVGVTLGIYLNTPGSKLPKRR